MDIQPRERAASPTLANGRAGRRALAVADLERWLATPGALSAFVHSLACEFDLARGRTLATLIAHDAMKFFFCVVVLFFLYLDGDALPRRLTLSSHGNSGHRGGAPFRSSSAPSGAR